MLTEPKSNGSPEASSIRPLPPSVATEPLEPATAPAAEPPPPPPPEAAAVLPVVPATVAPPPDLAAALATKFRWMLDSIGAGGVGERDERPPGATTADDDPPRTPAPPPIAAGSKLTRLWLSGRFR